MARRKKKDVSPSRSRGGALAALVPAARLLGIGWYFVGSILLGTGGGWWLGQQFSSPVLQVLFTILGVLCGLGAAAMGGYLLVREAIDEDAGGDGGAVSG